MLRKHDLLEGVWVNFRMKHKGKRRQLPLRREDVAQVFEAVFETIAEMLADGGEVAISQFGKFIVKTPPPGATNKLRVKSYPFHKTVRFRPSQILRQRLHHA